jgi:SHS2 domain-containing protein
MEAKTEKPASIEAQVAEWSATDANLREAVKATEGVTVAGFLDDKGVPNPKKGRDVVHAKMMTLANLRTGIEARRVELKAPILSLGRLVDSEAARLTGIVKGREDELRADRDAFDAEQKRVAEAAAAELRRKEEAERAERARILQARVNLVASLGGAPNLGWLSSATDEAFMEMVADLEKAKAEREELARIEAEKAERMQARVNLVASLGGAPNLGWLSSATDEAFMEMVADLEKAKAEREELARIEAEKAERIEVKKPDRVRAAEWAEKVLAILSAQPEFQTDSVRETVAGCAEFCADEMRALINHMEAK